MALTFTSASVTFLQALATILENVGRDIFISLAASTCRISSKQASRIASNSSIFNTTPSSLRSEWHFGRKQRSPGRHFIHLVFLGRILSPVSYEPMFITSLALPAGLSRNKIIGFGISFSAPSAIINQ
jgi:hypothetical protein